MKNFDYYNTTSPRKSKSEIKEEIYAAENFDEFRGTAKEIDTKKTELDQLSADAYSMHIKNIRQENADRIEEFKNDLLIYHGVNNHPKGDKCFELAWDFGHSEGLRNVQHFFERFVELIQH